MAAASCRLLLQRQYCLGSQVSDSARHSDVADGTNTAGQGAWASTGLCTTVSCQHLAGLAGWGTGPASVCCTVPGLV